MLLAGPVHHTRWPAKGFCEIRKTRRDLAWSPPRRARYPRPRPRTSRRPRGGPEEAPQGTKSMIEHSQDLLSTRSHPCEHLGSLGGPTWPEWTPSCPPGPWWWPSCGRRAASWRGRVGVRRYHFLSDEDSYPQTVFTVHRVIGTRDALSR